MLAERLALLPRGRRDMPRQRLERIRRLTTAANIQAVELLGALPQQALGAATETVELWIALSMFLRQMTMPTEDLQRAHRASLIPVTSFRKIQRRAASFQPRR